MMTNNNNVQELEALKSELEDSLDTTAAVQDLRQKREQEVVQLKALLDTEVKQRDSQIQELRHKHTQQLEQMNEQIDQLKKVVNILNICNALLEILLIMLGNYATNLCKQRCLTNSLHNNCSLINLYLICRQRQQWKRASRRWS